MYNYILSITLQYSPTKTNPFPVEYCIQINIYHKNIVNKIDNQFIMSLCCSFSTRATGTG